MNLNPLEINRKDLFLFGIMGLSSTGIYLYTRSNLILMNGVVSFVFTFIPARLERIRAKKDVKRL